MENRADKSTEKPRRRRLRCVLLAFLHVCALLLLMLAVCAMVVSRRIQPFYDWIAQTPLESMGLWGRNVITEKDREWRRRLANAPLLQDELETLQYFIDEIHDKRPNYVVRLQDGTQLYAAAVHAVGDQLEIHFQATGAGAQRIHTVPREQVVFRKHLVHPPVELLSEDVRFLLDYPDFDYYYLPPYLIVSDLGSYAKVHRAREVLDQLRGEFYRQFRILMQSEKPPKLMYVCLFKNEADYLRHSFQYLHPHLERAVGWYSQREDCLFVFDGLGSITRHKIDRQVVDMQEEIAALEAPDVAAVLESVSMQQQRSYEQLQRRALATLRHESAHQLAFTHGVHSWWGHENFWIQEGLAQYCETTPIGLLAQEKLMTLEKASEEKRLIPWIDVIDRQKMSDFAEYHDRIEVLYAQSWLLFYSLMQPKHQARFFAFLHRLQNWKTAGMPPCHSDLMTEYLQVPLAEIVQEMRRLIDQGKSHTTATDSF